MFVVLLKFSSNKGRAGELMDGHRAWIKRGFDDGVFLLVGNLEPRQGGGIVAHNTSLAELRGRVNDDPFVAEDVVSAEILEITPAKVDDRLTSILA
ncbi:MAG: YciI family protein [Candidatus Eiseniibacteriota bacterium]